MTETLTLSTPRRLVAAPVAILVAAVIVLASVALGFGIRTWTESTPSAATPIHVVQPVVQSSTPTSLIKIHGAR